MDTTSPSTPPSALKARSRLRQRQEVAPRATHPRKPLDPLAKKTATTTLGRYLTYWPLLALTILHIFVLRQVTLTVDPAEWRHTVLPNTYLPMLLLITSTSFFASSYLFLNTGRGLRIAGLVFFVYFFKFQNVILTVPLQAILCALFLLLELLSFVFQKKHTRKKG